MRPRCVRAIGHAPALACALSRPLHTRNRLPLVLVSHSNHLLHTSAHHRHDVTPLRKKLKEDNKATRSLKGQSNESTKLSETVDGWELTVGIEIHAQLNTSRKLFSAASTSASADPNTHLAPFDLALPGTQPVFQKATLIPALRAALALNCDIQPRSTFDRKHYFYHDQPAGYQITQYYHPFATNGYVVLDERDGLPAGDELRVGIKQIQMEQDTARTREVDDATIYVDFNRAGHPLIEIISLPEIHTPKAAAAYVRKIQGILSSVDALMAGLELGGMRADVNVSVRRTQNAATSTPGVGSSYAGITGLGTRTEIKNLSAFNGIEFAVRAERDRQISLLESGGTVIGETRGWSVTHPHTTRGLRGKEGEVDYRYMPDPDIPPLHIGPDLVQHLYDTLPRSPDQSMDILIAKYGLSTVDAAALMALDHGQRLYYFLDVVNCLSQLQGLQITSYEQTGKLVANWVLHELGSLLSTEETVWTPELVPAQQLAHIISLQQRGQLTHVSAKQVLKMVFGGDTRDIQDLIREEGLIFVAMSNEEYEDLAARVIAAYPDHVRDIREGGRHGKIKFLLGQMMRQAEKGKIQATTAEEVLKRQLVAPTKS